MKAPGSSLEEEALIRPGAAGDRGDHVPRDGAAELVEGADGVVRGSAEHRLAAQVVAEQELTGRALEVEHLELERELLLLHELLPADALARRLADDVGVLKPRRVAPGVLHRAGHDEIGSVLV